MVTNFQSTIARERIFDPEQSVHARGLVPRTRIAQELERHRTSVLVEIRGGAGWGKTSTALLHAAQRRREGADIVLFDARGDVHRAPAARERLCIVDDTELDPLVMDEWLGRAQQEAGTQIIVCSRQQHPLVRRARRQGLVAHRIELPEHPLTATELVQMGRARRLELEQPHAEYIVQAIGGWPVVAAEFLAECADAGGAPELRDVDALVGRSFETVLDDMLGASSTRLLARATLSPRGEQVGQSAVLSALVERISTLGLGSWGAA